MYTRALRPSIRPLILPYLEGEGELLCLPYCLSHSSRSFSRLSRSLREVESPAVRAIATRKYHRIAPRRAGRPEGRSLCLTSCVFCVPWLAALPPVPGNETHRPGGEWKEGRKGGRKEGGRPVSFSVLCFSQTADERDKKNAPVACAPAEGSSLEPLFYPPWLREGTERKQTR